MSDFDVLREWIAHDQSDFAERCRAVLRPAISELAEAAQQFAKLSERYDHHRHAIARRKIRKVAR